MDIPKEITKDKTLEAIWQSVVGDGERFEVEDIPSLVMLCKWHLVFNRCMDEINNNGDLQLTPVAKQASSEIRALNDQLGITAKQRTAEPVDPEPQKSANAKLLTMIFSDREMRASKAVGA